MSNEDTTCRKFLYKRARETTCGVVYSYLSKRNAIW
nr:MAG TPA: hypothetical protein [Caudoviricetes sp.]